MNDETEPVKKVLLLVSHPKVFKAMESALQEVECRMTDHFDDGLDAHLVIMDSFYLNSGMAAFVKKESPESLTLLVLLPNENFECDSKLSGVIDDIIALEPYHRHEDIFFPAVDWLRNAWHYSFGRLFSKEFGTGLWVSLMLALPRLVEFQSR